MLTTRAVSASDDRRLIPDAVYREILWHIPLGLAVVHVVDSADLGASVVISANPAALRMKAFEPDEVIGRPMREVLPQVVDTKYPELAVGVLRTKQPLHLGILRGVRHPDRRYSVRVFPLTDDCVGVSFEDVTSQQAHVEAEERFWKAFQAAPFAMCLMRREGELVEANEHFVKLFGFARREEIAGPRKVRVWADREQQKRILAEVAERGEVREAFMDCRAVGGREFRAVVALQAIKFGGEDCILALFWRS